MGHLSACVAGVDTWGWGELGCRRVIKGAVGDKNW
jgi:hypothetical protein